MAPTKETLRWMSKTRWKLDQLETQMDQHDDDRERLLKIWRYLKVLSEEAESMFPGHGADTDNPQGYKLKTSISDTRRGLALQFTVDFGPPSRGEIATLTNSDFSALEEELGLKAPSEGEDGNQGDEEENEEEEEEEGNDGEGEEDEEDEEIRLLYLRHKVGNGQVDGGTHEGEDEEEDDDDMDDWDKDIRDLEEYDSEDDA